MKKIEAGIENDIEAHELLALVDAQFRHYSESVKCFDKRIVDRIRYCVARHKEGR